MLVIMMVDIAQLVRRTLRQIPLSELTRELLPAWRKSQANPAGLSMPAIAAAE